ncbi:MAG: hypothetical protein IJ806_10545 [Ruminococcus sp.]|nr:hypothetical protein [Ruminococcus sp.]
MDIEKAYYVHMGPARVALDLGDGSERGEYVDQDYILHKLGRPHRSISLMYCYYPLDKEFPGRISEVMKDAEVSFQWDYPYDDYFTYKGGLEGDREGEPFTFMRDVRRHGQDVTLTLTVDPNVSDEQLIAIAEDLRTFGRVFLRVNHEATGNWFSFTKRTTYQGVADFYCRFNKILKEHAPNVLTVLCIGGIEDPSATEIIMEKEFSQAVRETDIWSVDKYMALHWGWPYDVALRGAENKSFKRDTVDNTYDLTKKSFKRFTVINGGKTKPMVMSEFNADGDVTGAYDQAKMVKDFCDLLKEDPEQWFSGFTFYQFRDRGRLGLEIEDPNNANCGIEQPVMETYKEILHDSMFMPVMERKEELDPRGSAELIWGNSEDAVGIEIPLHFEGDPHFCELTFEDDSNLMLEINGKWFYKSPKAKVIDLMSAFYNDRLEGPADLTLRIFAPPATGENDLDAPNGMFEYRYKLEKLPALRVEYEPVEL